MSSQATLTLATVEQALEMGLTVDEFNRIQEILGRTPNFCELSIFGVMWYEYGIQGSTTGPKNLKILEVPKII